MIFHIEVHSRDRQIEHYVVPNCSTEEAAIQRICQFYVDRGQRIGVWDRETDRNNLRLPYLIFRVEELPGDPVVYITGEYRSSFPI